MYCLLLTAHPALWQASIALVNGATVDYTMELIKRSFAVTSTMCAVGVFVPNLDSS